MDPKNQGHIPKGLIRLKRLRSFTRRRQLSAERRDPADLISSHDLLPLNNPLTAAHTLNDWINIYDEDSKFSPDAAMHKHDIDLLHGRQHAKSMDLDYPSHHTVSLIREQ